MITCALIALALLGYTYVGYPLCLGLLARLFPHRTSPGADVDGPSPMVSVCLPVHNGAAFLPAKIESLLAQDYPADRLEVIVYCDGCSDDSERIARDLGAGARAAGRIRMLANPDRRGKPTAINEVRAAARGEIVVFNDVRQPLAPGAVGALVRAMASADVGCATGNLVLDGAAGSGVYWRYENWIRRQESRFRGVIGMSGSIAAIRRADLDPLPEDLILDDVWIPMRLALRGKRVAFVAEASAYDAAFEDDREFRRKVRTLAGNYQLFARMPALLVPVVNPVWFETISHKVLRLVAPWLMLGLAMSSIAALAAPAPPSLAWLLVAGQAALYLGAALGPRAGRLAGVARTFVVLNSAAIVGLARHLTGRQRVTW